MTKLQIPSPKANYSNRHRNLDFGKIWVKSGCENVFSALVETELEF